MELEQRVQVEIMGAQRPYSYAWYFDPVKGELPLDIGDRVSLPGNQVQEEGTAGTVVAVGTSYKGELKRIVARIEKPPRNTTYDKDSSMGRGDDLWGGFGEGDYR